VVAVVVTVMMTLVVVNRGDVKVWKFCMLDEGRRDGIEL